MKTLSLVLSEAAIGDLSDIWEYIGQDNPEQADKALDEIYKKCELLASMPEMGRQREELLVGLRSFPVRRYIIFYRIQENILEIIQIVSGYQDIDAIFG
jgi:toxin ParE1/3/4